MSIVNLTLTSTIAVDALIGANGDADLAAERLHVPKQVLIAAIAADPLAHDSLAKQLRTLALLGTYEMLDLSRVAYTASIPELEPKQLARTVIALAALVAQLTDTHTQTSNVNITEVVLRMLPPDAREALKLLAQNPNPTIDQG